MNKPNINPTGWASDELEQIGAAEELRLTSLRRDGGLRDPLTIWAVHDGADIYVRSVNGPTAGWFRGTRVRRAGRVWAGGVEKDVRFENADPVLNDQIDPDYRNKYRRYAGSIIDRISGAQVRATALRLVPRPGPRLTGERIVSADGRTRRVAVITGASSGIGEATARALASDGYRVALLARRADRIEKIAAELGDSAIGIEAEWGVVGFSEGLREELQPNIRVTVIEPGAVATELAGHITHAATREATEQFARETAIEPQDIAELIAFVVSRPRWMTLNEILVRPTAQVS